MPYFVKRSMDRLNTCDGRLQSLFVRVVKDIDCTIICGFRGRVEQNQAHKESFSTLKWPKSKHNGEPSLAVDVMPWPVDWHDFKRTIFFAGFVMGIATEMKIDLKWGHDWNKDYKPDLSGLVDMPHYEVDLIY